MVVLQPTDFRDGDDMVWRLIWVAWRRLWKEDEITSVDTLQASPWAKSTMGTYYTHYTKLALSTMCSLWDGVQGACVGRLCARCRRLVRRVEL